MRFVKYESGRNSPDSSGSDSSPGPCYGYLTGSDDDIHEFGLNVSDSDSTYPSSIEHSPHKEDFYPVAGVQETSLTEHCSPMQNPSSQPSVEAVRRSYHAESRYRKTSKFTMEKNKAVGSSVGASSRKCKEPVLQASHVGHSLGFLYDKGNRVSSLCCMLRRLTSNQREALEEVGFGGILKLNIDNMPTHLDEWLLDHFHPASRYFIVEGRPKFMVAQGEVADIFGFSRSAKLEVTDICPNRKTLELISLWKILYKIPEGEVLTVDDLKSMLPILQSGCADFQRMCVLYILVTFLAPLPTKDVPLGLLNSLVDIGKIKYHNWSLFVLDHLCMSANRFGRNRSEGEFEGCILILLLSYFENCRLEGIEERCGLPVLEHWSEKNIRLRIHRELEIGVFGVGQFKSELVASELMAQSCTKSKFQQICDKVGSKAVMQTDILPQFNKDFDLGEGNDNTSTSEGTNLIDVDGNSQHMVPKGNDLPLLIRVNYGHIALRSCPVAGTSANNAPARGNSTRKRQLDYGPPNLDRIYLSKVACKYAQMPKMAPSDYDDELADYCLAAGSSFPNYEPLFFDDGDFLIFRSNMRSLEGPDDVSSMVMRTWALLLNDEWAVEQRKLCLDLVERGHMLYTDRDIVGRWMSWIKGARRDSRSADLFFIPLRLKHHYALIVINFRSKKVLCIESLVQSDQTLLKIAVEDIVSGFWILLKHLDDPRSEEQPVFDFELVHPPWSTEIPDGDSGICIMGLMTKFEGDVRELSGFKLDLAVTRNELKVACCATIVLDSRNIYRTAILGRLPSFIADKENGRVHPTVEAKKIAAICKTGMWQGSGRL